MVISVVVILLEYTVLRRFSSGYIESYIFTKDAPYSLPLYLS